MDTLSSDGWAVAFIGWIVRETLVPPAVALSATATGIRYESGQIVYGIKWNAAWKPLRMSVSNPSEDEPIYDVDIVFRPYGNIMDSARQTSGPPGFRYQTLGPGGIEMSDAEVVYDDGTGYPVIPVYVIHPRGRFYLPRLGPRESLGMIMPMLPPNPPKSSPSWQPTQVDYRMSVRSSGGDSFAWDGTLTVQAPR